MTRYLWPLLFFLVMTVALALGLAREGDPNEIPSPLIGKAVPSFKLPQLDKPQALTPEQLKGRVWVLNVWASWCATCREELPTLLGLALQSQVPMVGMSYQDKPAQSLQWLQQYGNPYSQVAVDADGRVGMDLGVIGVPETFVVDQQGRIRHKVSGPLTPEIVKNTLLPLIKELQRG
jgi:cytochrome c biogenesis protein CcmG, thiol:disulfide interchange protein DsbE